MVVAVERKADGTGWVLTFDVGGFRQEGRRMAVAGTFNGWATGLSRARSGFVEAGRRASRAAIELPEGTYEYKYYDMASGEWMEIERHPELYRGCWSDYVRNPFGTLNCVVRVPPGGGGG